MQKNRWSLRDLYRVMEESPENPVSKAQDKLDDAVFAAYGIKRDDDVLAFLLALNAKIVALEEQGKPVTGPGLPKSVDSTFITDDCVRMPAT